MACLECAGEAESHLGPQLGPEQAARQESASRGPSRVSRGTRGAAFLSIKTSNDSSSRRISTPQGPQRTPTHATSVVSSSVLGPEHSRIPSSCFCSGCPNFLPPGSRSNNLPQGTSSIRLLSLCPWSEEICHLSRWGPGQRHRLQGQHAAFSPTAMEPRAC